MAVSLPSSRRDDGAGEAAWSVPDDLSGLSA
jgi:hypothetical protein